MDSFEQLQQRLCGVWSALHEPGRPHVVVVLPSHRLVGITHRRYAERVPALEHRYLLSMLALARAPHREMVFVCSRVPSPDLVDYTVSLLPPRDRDDVLGRFRVLVVPGPTSRSLAENLLDRPDLVRALRHSLAARPAVIEPWHVTQSEQALALALDVPVHGSPPELAWLGTKSGSRRLFRRLGVPVAPGVEDVRTAVEVTAAVGALRDRADGPCRTVVKLDDATSGVGHLVLDATDDLGAPGVLPEWYLAELRRGGVVEQHLDGVQVTSPSVQLELAPCGQVRVLSTHEQVLTGPHGQVYDGCRFPADAAYAPALAGYGLRIGEELAGLGARGRVGVDFLARRDGPGPWELVALEINLRKGGTTHPLLALSELVPGGYDPASVQYRLPDGGSRAYVSTDNLVDPTWQGLAPRRVVDAIRAAGLGFDPVTGTGVVLHMLTGLAVDGRFGLTAIGTGPEHAEAVYATAVARIRAALASPEAATASPAGF